MAQRAATSFSFQVEVERTRNERWSRGHGRKRPRAVAGSGDHRRSQLTELRQRKCAYSLSLAI